MRTMRRAISQPPSRERARFVALVHTLVWDDAGRLLLLQRANTGFMDGHYTLPGGHREDGETVVGAALRECREEACIQVQAIRPVVVLPYADGVNFVFEAAAWRGDAHIGEANRCDAMAFAAVDRLPVPVAPFVRTALDSRTKRRWYVEGAYRGAAELIGGVGPVHASSSSP